MNEYDSIKMANLLTTELDMHPSSSPEYADLIIVNTCSIREKAENKVYSELGRWRNKVIKNPDAAIAVTGCVASQEAENLFQKAPYINIILGPQTIHRIADLYAEYKKTKSRQLDVSFPEIEKFSHLPKEKAAEPSAYLSIMEGCNKYCSYCIVPYTRGTEISRPFADILTEAKHLAQLGVREITLLGQNVNDYQAETQNGLPANLALLIQAVSAIDGIERIRFTTSHPAAFDDSLIQAYACESALCEHLHLPVQSGSDRVLKLMKRDYSVETYKSIISQLRHLRPNLPISTDIIVGFPGETDEDFAATLELVKWVGFDQSFSFIYSPRPGTPAAELEDNIAMSVKKERLYQLQELIEASAQSISQRCLGQTLPVLVEGPSKRNANEYMGRTEHNRVVNFQANANHCGQIINVAITDIRRHTLRGRVVVAANAIKGNACSTASIG